MKTPKDTDFGKSDFNYGSFVGGVTERFNSIDAKFTTITEGMMRIESKQDAQVAKMDISVKQFYEMMAELAKADKAEDMNRDKRIEDLERRQIFLAGGLSVFVVVLTLAKDAILRLI
jgi:hypothetical protein